MRYAVVFVRGMAALLVMLMRAILQACYLAYRAIVPTRRLR